MVVSAGVPVGVASRSIVSPAVTETVEPSEQVVPAPAIGQLRAVATPFWSTVSSQFAAPPGAVPTMTWRSETVPVIATGISTGPSVGDTVIEPHATYESVATLVSEPPPAFMTGPVSPCGPAGPAGP